MSQVPLSIRECLRFVWFPLSRKLFYPYTEQTRLQYCNASTRLSWSSTSSTWKKRTHLESWAFAPHAATSAIVNYFGYDQHWYQFRPYPTWVRSGSINSQAAAVRAGCGPNAIPFFSDSTMNICLPLLQKYATGNQGNAWEGQYITIQLPAPF